MGQASASPDGCIDEQKGNDKTEVSIVEEDDGENGCYFHGP